MVFKKLYSHGRFKIIHITRVIDGKLKSRTISPLTVRGIETDISNEPQEIQDACTEAWTPEVVEAYRAHLESVI